MQFHKIDVYFTLFVRPPAFNDQFSLNIVVPFKAGFIAGFTLAHAIHNIVMLYKTSCLAGVGGAPCGMFTLSRESQAPVQSCHHRRRLQNQNT